MTQGDGVPSIHGEEDAVGGWGGTDQHPLPPVFYHQFSTAKFSFCQAICRHDTIWLINLQMAGEPCTVNWDVLMHLNAHAHTDRHRMHRYQRDHNARHNHRHSRTLM